MEYVDTTSYQRTQMQKNIVIQRLKEMGCRITRQRLIILDVVLEEECSCCKEIYYKAVKKDTKISYATVYRMINMLEDVGAINRKNMYNIDFVSMDREKEIYIIEFEDDTTMTLAAEDWYQIVQAGLEACGYKDKKNVRTIMQGCGQDELG